jgi:hypothetical protein
VGYSDVTITSNGSVTIDTKFSNGKQIGGNNFFSVVTFRSASGGVLGYFVQWKGLDGSFRGHAREARATDQFKLQPTAFSQFDHVDFRFGVRNCGFKVTGFHLGDGDKNNGVTMSTVECGNQPPRRSKIERWSISTNQNGLVRSHHFVASSRDVRPRNNLALAPPSHF